MEKKKCYALMCETHSGSDIAIYWDKYTAFKAMIRDLETEITNLQRMGEKGFESAENDHNALLYVPGTDIYYEWDIVETTIE